MQHTCSHSLCQDNYVLPDYITKEGEQRAELMSTNLSIWNNNSSRFKYFSSLSPNPKYHFTFGGVACFGEDLPLGCIGAGEDVLNPMEICFLSSAADHLTVFVLNASLVTMILYNHVIITFPKRLLTLYG
ncbi:uncharacterized protein METZ01_LOCUS355418, partial [marine metagenome]